jgi:hypothetical protein
MIPLAAAAWLFLLPPASVDLAPITAPPAALVEQLGLHPFYAKCLLADGFPILASARVRDSALREARYLIDRMLLDRDDLRAEMVRRGARLVVMAWDERTTDIPEHADLWPTRYWDKRARGLGATDARPVVTVGEENLLAYDGDPYFQESILVHEFAHAIHQMALESLSPGTDQRLREAYRGAMAEGLWKDKYAATNANEYWAEGVQSWFGTNRPPDHDHNFVDTRAELREYDPALAAVIEEVFGAREWTYRSPRERSDQPHLRADLPGRSPIFSWSKDLLDWYDAWPERERELERRVDEGLAPWHRRRAAAGDPRSQYWVASSLLEAEVPDPAAALGLLELAARQGHTGAMNTAAGMYAQGQGCEGPAPESAYRWWVRAASRGDDGARVDREQLARRIGRLRAGSIEKQERSWLPSSPD